MTITHIVSIDPGLSGAISLLRVDGGQLFDVADMPTRKTVTAAGKKATVIDVPALAETINDYIGHAYGPEHVAIVIDHPPAGLEAMARPRRRRR